MNAWAWSIRLSWILDFLALSSLAGTGEVRLELFILIAALFIVSRMGVVRVSERIVLAGLVLVLLSSVGVWFYFRFHPIVAASYVAPLVHCVLFFAPKSARYRGWRLGIGFAELVLASSLAADFYLFPAIFLFVLLGSVAVSCGFLDEELRSRAPEIQKDALPAGFIRQSVVLAALIFLTSLLIFPILPRMNMAGHGIGDSFKVGYTEHVELSDKKGLNGHEGTGEPALRLYSPDGLDLTKEIYLGLVRGRSLDVFDGVNWLSSPKRSQVIGPRYIKPADMRDAIWVDAIRAPLHSISLPVPYGTIQAQTGTSIDDVPEPRTTGGEWVDPSSTDSRVHFVFAFFSTQKVIHRLTADEDAPIASDLTVPEALKNERMERLEKNIFLNAKTEEDKAAQILTFFSREHFSASLSDVDSETELSSRDIQQIPAVARMHPMERFLFLTKVGHCEWFASSTAVLLRMAGVPARLAAGFRVSKGPVGGILTLTTNDAHAWVEYWRPGKGWTALDPTPRLIRPPSILNVVRDGYEWVSAYWYRYVLNFTDGHKKEETEPAGFNSATPKPAPLLGDLRTQAHRFIANHQIEILGAFLAFLFLCALTYGVIRWKYPWVFSIRHRVREGDASLRRERVRMERLVARRGAAESVDQVIRMLEKGTHSEAVTQLKEWQDAYLRLRFGLKNGKMARSSEIANLRKQYGAIKRKLSQTG